METSTFTFCSGFGPSEEIPVVRIKSGPHAGIYSFDGNYIRVYDDVARHFTLCFLPPRLSSKIRKALAR